MSPLFVFMIRLCNCHVIRLWSFLLAFIMLLFIVLWFCFTKVVTNIFFFFLLCLLCYVCQYVTIFNTTVIINAIICCAIVDCYNFHCHHQEQHYHYHEPLINQKGIMPLKTKLITRWSFLFISIKKKISYYWKPLHNIMFVKRKKNSIHTITTMEQKFLFSFNFTSKTLYTESPYNLVHELPNVFLYIYIFLSS